MAPPCERAASARRPSARSSLALLVLTVGAVVVVVAGFLGLDRWFYEHVSLYLERPDRIGNRDFYATTKLFWLACRYSFGYGIVPLAVLLGFVALDPGRWRKPASGAFAIVIAALVANGAQAAIGRLRPNQATTHLAFTQPFAEIFSKQGVSFPSGEAATALAGAYVLSRLLPRWRAVFYACGALAAVARLVNGAHYVSDVAAGALLGILVAKLSLAVLDRISPQRTGS
jgi:membrane-associated phospholipid phosphatase